MVYFLTLKLKFGLQNNVCLCSCCHRIARPRKWEIHRCYPKSDCVRESYEKDSEKNVKANTTGSTAEGETLNLNDCGLKERLHRRTGCKWRNLAREICINSMPCTHSIMQIEDAKQDLILWSASITGVNKRIFFSWWAGSVSLTWNIVLGWNQNERL